ncbi:MAG: tetratricopeptide repeat protein [Nitrospirae bacterium]|nr:tetratricopeptide repeat protein [Nitrospirota bacterium]
MLTMLIIPLTLIGIDKPAGGLVDDVGETIKGNTPLSRQAYLINEFRVIFTYLRLLFFPVNQNLDYDYPVYRSVFNPPVFLSLLFLLSIFGLAVYLFYRSRYTIHDTRFTIHDKNNTLLRRELKGDNVHHASCIMYRFVAFGIFWFFINLLPESSLIPLNNVIFEHRVYLPSVGVVIAFGTALFGVIQRRGGSATVRQNDRTSGQSSSFSFLSIALSLYSSVALIGVLSIAAYQRNTIWKDEVSLCEDMVMKSPKKARVHNNVGLAYQLKGWDDRAIEHYQMAINLDPEYITAHYNLFTVYANKGWANKGKEHLDIARRLMRHQRGK